MNRNELKNYITKILLEKVECNPVIEGKLIKKTISFTGISREIVCEGTVDDSNKFAKENELTFTKEKNSHFGGHYTSEMTSYEFQPNPEFYGEIMESEMTAREQLARICGNNNQILTEVDVQNLEKMVDYIIEDAEFYKNKTNFIFSEIKNRIKNKIYDKSQFSTLFEILVKQAKQSNFSQIDLNESDLNYATNLLSKKFFNNFINQSNSNNSCSGDINNNEPINKIAFGNMKQIVSY